VIVAPSQRVAPNGPFAKEIPETDRTAARLRAEAKAVRDMLASGDAEAPFVVVH
jgi:hypothetical protein